MGFKCGIVGLPNVGKSTLFNALTRTAAAQAANYPFCTIEPNVGEVAVPEPRLTTPTQAMVNQADKDGLEKNWRLASVMVGFLCLDQGARRRRTRRNSVG